MIKEEFCIEDLEVKVKSLVNSALDRLYNNDAYLFKEDTSERSIVFHFGRHFIDIINDDCSFKGYNVDSEYNRSKSHEKNQKVVVHENKEHRRFPDIILHKRDSDKNNILVIEFKKYSNYSKVQRKIDYDKLKAFTGDEHKYKVGLFISLGKIRDNVKIKTFINGNEVSEKN